MKWILIMTFFLPGMLVGGEMEVRSYNLSFALFAQAHKELTKSDEEANEGLAWLGPEVVEVPFDSRFFKRDGNFRDCTMRVKELFKREGFEGKAVYDLTRRRLVVKAELGEHRKLARKLRLGVELDLRARTRVRVLKRVEDTEEVVFNWSITSEQGKWTTSDGEGLVELEGESHFGYFDDPYFDCFLSMKSKIPGAEFELLVSYPAINGKALQVGSFLDASGKLITVEVRHEKVLRDGSPGGDWILTEATGKRPGVGGRAIVELKEEFLKFENGERVRKVMEASPELWVFLNSPMRLSRDYIARKTNNPRYRPPFYEGRDPALSELKQKELFDFSEVFCKNGISLEDGDFVVCVEEPPLVFMEVAKDQVDLLRGILEAAENGSPIGVMNEVFLVESDREIRVEDVVKRGSKILKKASVFMGEGRECRFQFGKEFRGKVELQVARGSRAVELRVGFENLEDSRVVDAVRSGVTMRSGKPLILTQSEHQGRWRGMVLKVRDRLLGAEIRGRKRSR